MRRNKKLWAVMLSLLVVLTMTVPAFAVNSGKITINNAVDGQTYKIYRIFDIDDDSFTPGSDTYDYKVTNEKWKAFFTTGEGKDYVEIDSNDKVTWKEGVDRETDTVQKLAQAALTYAKENNITPTASETASGESVTFSSLSLGYYLIESNVGTLCVLTTTEPDVTVEDKNDKPTVEKKVKDGEAWEDSNTAEIGDTVDFQVTITAGKGAEKYILHEQMDEGLTFNESSVQVTKKGDLVNPDNYTVNSPGLIEHTEGKCTFEVVFKDNFCDSLSTGDKIVVTYSAVLNENANVETGEKNSVYLTYGEDSSLETLPKETVTNTYQFQIIKTNSAAEDGTYEVLTGATFSLYDVENGGAPIKLVKEGDTDTYRVATENETNTVTLIEAGTPILKGLAGKTYWLEEVNAPDGFNPLNGRVAVTLTGNNIANEGAISTDNSPYTYDSDIGGGVQIKNSKGLLPSTGGMGTVLFYAAGIILIAGAGTALYRMNRKTRDYDQK